MMLGGTDSSVLERISKIMSYMNLAGEAGVWAVGMLSKTDEHTM